MKNIAIFTMLHYPDKATFFSLLDLLAEHSIGYVELGIPVEDPYTDGKIIQQVHQDVLKKGLTHGEIMETLKEIRDKYAFNVVLMTYKSGVETFQLELLDTALYDGIICVDALLNSDRFPSPIHIYSEQMEDFELKTRSQQKSLFNYVVSGQGKTGTFKELPTEYIKTIRRLKANSASSKNFVGFGVKNQVDRETVLNNGADGIIIGTEFLKQFNDGGIEGVKLFLEQFDE